MARPDPGEERPKDESEDERWGPERPTALTLRPTLGEQRAVPSLTDEEDLHGLQTAMKPAPKGLGLLLAGNALPTSIRASLKLLGSAETVHAIVMARTIVGRGENCDIQLKDERASRKHASILYVGNEFRIRDEGSSNGTFLNGSRVVEYALRDGDELLIGDARLAFSVTGV